MSLDLINVGTEPNDGTGDPPRVAGQKINANFQAISQALAGIEPSAQLDARDTANRARANHTGTQTAATIADFAATAAAAAPVQSVAGRTGAVTLAKADVGLDQVDNTADDYKPISAATGAALTSLANSTQAALNLKLEAVDIAAFETNAQLDTRDTANRARANHTGAQAISTVTGLQTALDAKLEAASIANFETTTQLNARDTANRARANHTGTQSAATIADFAATAAAAAPVQSVAGKTGAVSLAKADVGLGNVDNTTDAAKPISTATQTALDLKAPLTTAQGTVAYASTVNLDMAALTGSHQTITLTGNLTLTTSNRATGRTVSIRLICDSTLRALTFPGSWVFLGTKPSNIAANKVMVLSLTFFGSNDSDCIAAVGIQT